MRDNLGVSIAAITVVALAATVLYATAEDTTVSPPPNEQSALTPVPLKSSSQPKPGGAGEPSVTVLDHQEAQGILGKEVRGPDNENMGRIVDVIVDRSGEVRAAIIDFGGFLGVGSRKIAVAWNALSFPSEGKKISQVNLDLTRDQVRAAPEYKPDKPIVVLGPAGNLESLPLL
jgi:hypothetical protein